MARRQDDTTYAGPLAGAAKAAPNSWTPASASSNQRAFAPAPGLSGASSTHKHATLWYARANRRESDRQSVRGEKGSDFQRHYGSSRGHEALALDPRQALEEAFGMETGLEQTLNPLDPTAPSLGALTPRGLTDASASQSPNPFFLPPTREQLQSKACLRLVEDSRRWQALRSRTATR